MSQRNKSLWSDRRHRESDDRARLARLAEYEIVGTAAEREYDDIVRLAAEALRAPIAIISITEAHRHWFKATHGLNIREVPRSTSFCDHTMRQDGVFSVFDASLDDRFCRYPLVCGELGLRFYIGANLLAPDGHKIGTFCVADTRPRRKVGTGDIEALKAFARIASDRLELRRHQLHLIREKEKSRAAEMDARFAHERLRDAIEMLPEAIAFMDAEDRYVLWNKAYSDLYPDIAHLLAPGVSFEHILRSSVEGGAHPEIIEDADKWIAWRLEQHRKATGTLEQQFQDGRWMRHEQRKTSDGGTIGLRIDITELKTREENFRLLFKGNPVPMWVYDQQTLRFLAVNDAAVGHYGYLRDQFLAMSLPDLQAGEPDDAPAKPARKEERVAEHLTASGKPIKVTLFTHHLRFHGKAAVLTGVVDVTERVEAEQRARFLAQHDVLTSLANRGRFDERLAELLPLAKNGDQRIAVCLVDVDHFKSINDTSGHSGGDAVLRAVARHLTASVRASDLVARLGGDEFGIILAGLGDEGELRELASRILDLKSIGREVGRPALSVGASIGIARFPYADQSPDTLVQDADFALYKSKADGRGRYTIFGSELRRRCNERTGLHNRFREALSLGEIVPYYQPIVDLTAGTLYGFEALVRWRTPDRGLLAAGEFSSVFEDHDLSATLGSFMLDAVTDDMRRWNDLGLRYGLVALNMTAADLLRDGFADHVLNLLRTKHLRPDRLIVETTENVVIGSPGDRVTTTLNELALAGVRIALDDFGTGYASLAHLKKINVSILKIDKSFVQGLGNDQADSAIVSAVIGLGKNLGIKTIAEGVETVQQASLLQGAGCDFAQGYKYGKPSGADRMRFVVAALGESATRLVTGRRRSVA